MAPKTAHQENLKSLMKMVRDRQIEPETMHHIILSAMTGLANPEIAPLVLYPFANPALLFQYCCMNYSIMATDCRLFTTKMNIPCSVVYSQDDETTHPDGSRVIAHRLGASPEVVDVSGHMDVLQGRKQDVAKVIAFQYALVTGHSSDPEKLYSATRFTP